VSAPRLYIGKLNSSDPLPRDLLARLDVSADSGHGEQVCTRCDKTWSTHAWLVWLGQDVVLDCSGQPRQRS
jgi:hypothetical protein